MAKIVVIYDKTNPDDMEEFHRAYKSADYVRAIWQILHNVLRPRWKYGVGDKTAEVVIDEVWTEVHAVLGELSEEF